MKIIRGIKHIPKFRASVVCMGVFDGVHLGHQKIIRKALARAKALGVPSVAVTMNPHPSKILTPSHPRILLHSLEHRLLCLSRMNLDYCLVIAFTQSFSRVSAEDFVRNILIRRLKARAICVGDNFHFGHRALGSADLLRQRSKESGWEVHAVKVLKAKTRVISSTRIRQLILKGALREAAQLTGRPISLFGMVIRGKGRGKRLGYPTINLDLRSETLPPSGIYAVWAREGRHIYRGALHLGPRPTFREDKIYAEVHLFSVRKSLYGKEIEIYLVQKIRQVKRFSSSQDLAEQIARDVRQIKQILSRTKYPKPDHTA